jgi:hypothetical protein
MLCHHGSFKTPISDENIPNHTHNTRAKGKHGNSSAKSGASETAPFAKLARRVPRTKTAATRKAQAMTAMTHGRPRTTTRTQKAMGNNVNDNTTQLHTTTSTNAGDPETYTDDYANNPGLNAVDYGGDPHLIMDNFANEFFVRS